ncbi:MAG: NAD(P)-dependent oxidoreductase [Pseudomonadota bacterium]
MIIVDTALAKREAEGRPIRVGVIGAGYMGRGLVITIVQSITGMVASAVYNRTLATAATAYEQAGIDAPEQATSVAEVEACIDAGRPVITDDPMLICEAGNIDCIVESTGEVEFGAQVTLRAIEYGKHVVLLNAELDAVVGPVLKQYADRQGVTITNCDGDQPGVVMNLHRWVKSIGYDPLMCGNIKGLQDNYRTPATQKAFADRVKQKPKMITSFADGTKISMEMAVVANATGFRVGTRGMYGPTCSHVTEAPGLFDLDELRQGGLVDYILGAEPGPGVFVLGYNENPILQQYASYLKMGDGPLYTFYVPYHLPHLETPLTVARAVLFEDAAATPLAGPVADVLTVAKTDLRAGDTLDGIGGFHCFGSIDNYATSVELNALPMSLSEGCVLTRDIAKDTVITYADVTVPEGRAVDRLRQEQIGAFD